MKPEYLMIIDILPSSKLDITKYMERHEIPVFPDLHKENRFRIKCEHDAFCGVFNELVMMKDFQRDDDIIIKHKMDILQKKLFIFENSHISNLLYCRLSNKKLYKHYMKEFKRRRKDWKYTALVIRKKGLAKNKKEETLYKEIIPVLKQCQINYKVIDKWKNLTFLRKEILKQVNSTEETIEIERIKEEKGWQ
jgi:hypothetical protein